MKEALIPKIIPFPVPKIEVLNVKPTNTEIEPEDLEEFSQPVVIEADGDLKEEGLPELAKAA